VVATRADGNLNHDLKRDDFLVFEDGKPQEVEQFQVVDLETIAAEVVDPPGVFSNRAEPGAVFALVLDDMNIDGKHTALLQTTARKFVDEQVRSGDYIGVMRRRTRRCCSPPIAYLVRPMIAQTMGRRDISDVASLTGGPETRCRRRPEHFPDAGLQRARAVRPVAIDSHSSRAEPGDAATGGPVPRADSGAPQSAVVQQGVAFDLEAFAADNNSRSFDTMRRLLAAAREGNVAVYTVDPRGLQGSTDPSVGERCL
jgi:hypothetical protein